MDSLDSPEFPNVPPVLNDNNCEELFDKLFQNDDDDELELNVQRPKKTYQKNRKKNAIKTVKFMEDESDFEEEYHGNEPFRNDAKPILSTNETKAVKSKKKKFAYPNVSKDAVLEAFNKAVESCELPNFDEIDQFPLSIVTYSENSSKPSKKRSSPKAKRMEDQVINDENVSENEVYIRKRQHGKKVLSEKSTNKSGKQSKKSITKAKSIKDQIIEKENAPEKQLNNRKSQSKKRVLSEKSSNKSNNTEKIEKSLVDLDESCIPLSPTNKINYSFEKAQKKTQKANKIQTSTPFRQIQNTQRTLRSNTRSRLNY